MSFTVDVHDEVNTQLTGHDGAAYTSPTLSGQEAADLVALLLERPRAPLEPGTFNKAIAGGRRTVTLRALASEQLTFGE